MELQPGKQKFVSWTFDGMSGILWVTIYVFLYTKKNHFVPHTQPVDNISIQTIFHENFPFHCIVCFTILPIHNTIFPYGLFYDFSCCRRLFYQHVSVVLPSVCKPLPPTHINNTWIIRIYKITLKFSIFSSAILLTNETLPYMMSLGFLHERKI